MSDSPREKKVKVPTFSLLASQVVVVASIVSYLLLEKERGNLVAYISMAVHLITLVLLTERISEMNVGDPNVSSDEFPKPRYSIHTISFYNYIFSLPIFLLIAVWNEDVLVVCESFWNLDLVAKTGIFLTTFLGFTIGIVNNLMAILNRNFSIHFSQSTNFNETKKIKK